MAKKANSAAVKAYDLALPIAEKLGVSLWDVQFEKEGANWILRVVIDNDDRPITLDDCEAVSRALDPVLDEADPIEQSYFLEVSSPGVERELVRESHFEKFMGKRINLKLIRPLDDVRDFNGKLIGYDGKTVSISCEGGDYMFEISDCAFIKAADEES